MPMTQEELLARLDVAVKALTTTDLNGSKLQPEVADRFIRSAIDTSKIIKECRVLPMKSDTRNIDRIYFAARIMQAATEATEPGSTSKPTIPGPRQLIAKEALAAVDVSYSTLEDNIEGESFEDTLVDMIGERASADLEELYLYAAPGALDDGGLADAYLQLPAKNGWLRMTAADGVNVVAYADAAPAKISDALQAMLEAVPSKYFGDLSQWRFYLPFKAERKYREELAERATSAGDRALLEDVPVFYQGIPIIWIPKIKGHDVGGTETDRGTAGSVYEFLFAHPANLVTGFKRDVTMETERKPRARNIEFTLTCRTDMNVEEPGAICVADRVLVS